MEYSKKASNCKLLLLDGYYTSWVGNFLAATKIKAPKEIFDSFVEVEFEGKKYKAPAGWDQWLTCFYKNYMELPPIEKRVSHHLFKAYIDVE